MRIRKWIKRGIEMILVVMSCLLSFSLPAYSSGVTSPVAGFGQTIEFNGSNYVEIPSNSSHNITNNFTIEFWFKPSSTTQSQKYLASRNSIDIAQQWGVIYEYLDNKVEFHAGSGYTGDNPRTGSAMTINDTNWHHLAYTYDGTNWRGYMDGIEVFSLARNFALSTVSNKLYIGGTYDIVPANLVQGRIDEVRIWKTGLSATTLTNWMYREVDPTHPDYANLANYYQLNEGTGTVVTDAMGVVNGTFVNGQDSHWQDSGIRSWSTNEDEALSGKLVGSQENGSSNDGADWKLDFSITAQGSKGLVAIDSENNFTYTPNENENGSDTFTYVVSDGRNTSNEFTVNVTINAVNDAPGQPGAFTSPTEGQIIQGGNTVPVAWGAASDIEDDTLTYTVDFYNGSSWITNVYSGNNTSFVFSNTGGINTTSAKFRVKANDASSSSSYRESNEFTIDSEYTVSFDSNGGSAVDSQTVDYNETAADPADPSMTGYTFAGWYSDSELTTAFSFTTGITEDITLYAKWTINSYTVIFNSNGGSAVDSQAVDYNDTATEPADPTKTGYTFGGWYSDSELTTTFSFNTVITGDVTLYAQWTINSYTVSFDSNGGSTVNSQSVDYNSTVTEPDAPTKTGYTFGGWYTDNTFATAFDFANIAITGDTTIYAKWTINQYTVSFDVDGGSAVDSQSVDYNETATEPTDPTKTGYTFTGWYTDNTFATAFDFINTTITDDTTIYAKWSINSYTVSFDSNGGSAVNSQAVNYNSTASEPDDPTKTGYTFAGWYSDLELTSAFDFTTAISGDITLYAKWDIVQSNIATVTSDNYTVSAGGTANETITNVPAGTSKADFLGGLIKGQADQTWDATGLNDPVVYGNTLEVTAQDGITKVTYTVIVRQESPGVYAFNNLAEGLSLHGKDNWVEVRTGGTSTQIHYVLKPGGAAPVPGHDGTNAARFLHEGSGAGGRVSRINDGNFTFPTFNPGDIYVIEFEMNHAYWGSAVGLGYDAGGNGDLNGNTEIGVKLTVGGSGTGNMRRLTKPDGTFVAGTNDPALGAFNRYQIIIDQPAYNGAGSASVYYLNLASEDTVWRPITGLQNLNMGLDFNIANSNKNPSNWNGIRIRSEGSASLFDNISIRRIKPSVREVIFDQTAIDSTSLPQTITLEGENLTGRLTASLEGDFVFADGSTQAADLTNGSSLTVKFAPTGTGDREGTLVLQGEDMAAPLIVPLSGEGRWPITSVGFEELNPVVTGEIDHDAHTVTLTVPYEIDVTTLVPTITYTGTSISPSGGAEQDFSDPVTYTVTAADGSTQTYTVTVIVDEPINYTVTFENWDGSELKTETVEHGNGATAPTEPTREGYHFIGWDVDFSSVTSDLIVTATFAINQYTVTYNSNEGTAVDPQTVNHNAIATEPITPTRTGYTFAGWYADAGLTTPFNYSTAITGETTLYAKWNINSYTVNFSSTGGSAVDSQTVDYNSSATEPAAPSKTGYTFAGWYTDSDLTSLFNFATPITGDTTLYVQWSINSYAVSFNSNGGSAVNSQDVDYNTLATEPADPIRTGYTFAGWYADVELTTPFNFTTPITGDTTVYAQWSINSYTVSFNSNGGSAVDEQAVDYNTLATEPDDPTRTGYTFGGWYSDAELTTPFNFATPITGDTTPYAKWSINSYTVSFNSNGGSEVQSQAVDYNGTASEPAMPTKTGYSFGGWYSDSELTTAFDFTTAITGDVTLYAKWSINSYTVSFNSYGGSAVGSQAVDYNSTVEEPADPSKTGHSFAGWYSDSELIIAYNFATAITGDVVLYAKWTINSYTVSFNSNGGSAIDSQAVDYNSMATEPTAPTRTGYIFGGWYLDAELTTPFNFTTSITGDVTLYAQWSISSYTVTFNSNGGSAVDNQAVDYNSTATEPEAPTKTGYTFAGWNTDNTFATAFDFANTAITDDTTIYARWTINQYTVGFSSNGGSEVQSQTVDYNGTATQPEASTKTGYTFVDWYADAELATPFEFTTPITGDTTLYAKWSINSYTVSFNSNGGSAVDSQTVNYNSTASEPADPTKTGYTFAGWYADADLTTPFNFTTAITGDITLYAKWIINSYTVSFNSNGGSAVDSQAVNYNSTASEPDAPTKTGYTFVDWYVDAELTTPFEFTTPITGGTTLYAKWSINSYTVSFNSNGGSAVDSQTVDYTILQTNRLILPRPGTPLEGGTPIVS